MPLELISNKVPARPDKPLLLLVHGMWHAAWVWEPSFLPQLGALGYRAYAMSLSHHGKSSKRKPLNLLRIRDYVHDLRQVILSLDRPPVLIGHSMGGFIVQKYLEQYDDVPAAVLLAPVPPFGVWSGTLVVLRKFPVAFLKANLTLNLAPIINDLSRYRYLLSSPNVPKELDEKNLQKIQSESFFAYLDMLGLNLVKTQKVKVPLSIMSGEKDRVIVPAVVKKTARKYGIEPLFFKGMGHNLMMEPQSHHLAKAIDDWIKKLGVPIAKKWVPKRHPKEHFTMFCK